MTKRESGWYRVMPPNGEWEVARYSSNDDGWCVSGDVDLWYDCSFIEIGPMVMTLDGELCAGGAQHDPVFNTKQEG